ncbi:MAG: hypothetical protein ACFB51_17075 [Anaerolineae bacterium]
MLEIRAGVPFSSVEMLKRFHRLDRMDKMIEVWYEWEEWFVELEQPHTSLPMLVFLRSPSPRRSWITAAGTVMDTAALMLATVDHPDAQDAQASICIRAGYIALRAIADFFNIPYDPDPMPSDAISIDRSEFDDVIAELRRAGVPLVDDIDQAWQDFRGWRVNYDGVLLAIANLTMAPYAAWISDRSAVRFGPSNLTDPIAAEAIRTAAPTPD